MIGALKIGSALAAVNGRPLRCAPAIARRGRVTLSGGQIDALHHSTFHARAAEIIVRHYPYRLNEEVRYRPQGPQGVEQVVHRVIYTIIQCMPIEADGRLRYRIKTTSENIEIIVAEDQLSYSL